MRKCQRSLRWAATPFSALFLTSRSVMARKEFSSCWQPLASAVSA